MRRTGFYRWLRRIAVASLLLIAAAHVANWMRLDASALRAGGRAVVDRARQARDRAHPDYQERALSMLRPNPRNGPYYRLDDLLRKATVIHEPPARDGGEDSFLLQLEFEEDDEPGLVAAAGQLEVECRDGFLVARQRGEDALTNESPLRVPKALIGDIVIRARADKGSRFLLQWEAEDRAEESWRNKLTLDLIADGELHTYVVNAKNALKSGAAEGESITRLTFTPSNVDGATVEIDYIRIISKLAKYRGAPRGLDYETLGSELRPVLYMLPDQALEYAINVPENQPVLHFGAGALSDSAPVTFRVVLSDETGATLLYDQQIEGGGRWEDARLDLSPWAGRPARLMLEARGPQDGVALWSNPMVSSAPRERFNVMLILEDALRADHLSVYGHTRPTSPFKAEWMRESGVLFLNAISQATKTRPSIPTLMTSLYASATGVWDFSDMLSGRYLTLAEILRNQGFATAAFIQNGNAGPFAGLHQGFSHLYDDHAMGSAAEKVYGGEVVSWLERNRERNLFLYLHLIDPHGPYDPEPPFDRWYREAPQEDLVGDGILPLGPGLDPSWAEHPTALARNLLYDGEIRHNDELMKGFFARLEEIGLLQDTLVIFVSDHGEWMGELGHWDHHPPGNMPAIHVPMMISYEKEFPTPRRIEETVQLVDVMPTVLDLAGVDTTDLLLQGDSLVGLARGEAPDPWRQRVTVSEEPLLMSKEDPCACGSLFFQGWQVQGSGASWPWRLPSPFLKTRVYRFREDGIRASLSFLPDLHIRYLRHRIVSDLQSANLGIWRALTQGEEEGVYRMDPDTLERLRALGYLN